MPSIFTPVYSPLYTGLRQPPACVRPPLPESGPETPQYPLPALTPLLRYGLGNGLISRLYLSYLCLEIPLPVPAYLKSTHLRPNAKAMFIIHQSFQGLPATPPPHLPQS